MAAAAAAATATASISVRPDLPSRFRAIHKAHAYPTLDVHLPEAKPLQHLKSLLLLPSFPIPRRFLHAAASAAAALTETDEEEEGEAAAAAGEEEEQPQPRPTSTARGEEGRLYVGNLPYSMTSAQLAEVFSEAGTVDAVEVVYDRVTDRSRGFAFVTMASVEEANEAIGMFNGAQVGGRTVKVNFPEVPRGGEREVVGRRARASSRGYVDSPNKVYAGNLGWTVTSQSLKDAFGAQPGLLGAKVIYDRDSGRSRGFGFVSFASDDEAQAAIDALNGVEVEGRPLRLSPAQERPPLTSAASQAPDSGTVAEPAGSSLQSSLS